MDDLRDKIAAVIADTLGEEHPMDEHVADAIIAALPGMVAPLVWNPTGISYLTQCGSYRIIDTPSRTDSFRLLSANFGTTYVGDFCGNGALQAAKAAANAHNAAAVVAAFKGVTP